MGRDFDAFVNEPDQFLNERADVVHIRRPDRKILPHPWLCGIDADDRGNVGGLTKQDSIVRAGCEEARRIGPDTSIVEHVTTSYHERYICTIYWNLRQYYS